MFSRENNNTTFSLFQKFAENIGVFKKGIKNDINDLKEVAQDLTNNISSITKELKITILDEPKVTILDDQPIDIIENYRHVANQEIKSSDVSILPVKSKPVDTLKSATSFTHDTAHPKQLVYKEEDPETLYLFKLHNAEESPLLTNMEAISCSFYRHLAPDKAPSIGIYHNIKNIIVGLTSKLFPNFRTLKSDPLTMDDLHNPEVVKGLAIGLTLSYIFEENDLHKKNMDKFGNRVDFDESLRPISHVFKGNKYTEGTFIASADDIINLPIVVDTKTRYWPCNGDSTTSMVLENQYTTKESEVFKHLAQDQDFIYYKFKTLLKFILDDTEVYHDIADRFLNDEIYPFGYGHNGKKIVDVISEHISNRKQQLREILISTQQFREFMENDGIRALNEITQEFKAANDQLNEKRIRLNKNYPTSFETDIEKIEDEYLLLSAAVQKPMYRKN